MGWTGNGGTGGARVGDGSLVGERRVFTAFVPTVDGLKNEKLFVGAVELREMDRYSCRSMENLPRGVGGLEASGLKKGGTMLEVFSVVSRSGLREETDRWICAWFIQFLRRLCFKNRNKSSARSIIMAIPPTTPPTTAAVLIRFSVGALGLVLSVGVPVCGGAVCVVVAIRIEVTLSGLLVFVAEALRLC